MHLPGGDGLPEELGVLESEAAGGVPDRAAVAQHLLHRGLQERGLRAQPLQLFRVLEQRPDAVGDEVHRRLVPRHQQQEHHARELHGAEPVSVLLGGEQGAGEIVPRLGAAPGEEGLEVLLHLDGRLPQGLQVGALGRGEQRGGPLAEPGLVLGGYAQQLGDDGDGQREGERLEQVHVPVRRERIQQLLGDGGDAGPQGLHSARGEGLGDQRAQPGVRGRIRVQHVLVDLPDLLHPEVAEPILVRQLVPVLDEARILHQLLGVPVAADDPHGDTLRGAEHPGDRSLLAHPRAERQRIDPGLGRPQVEGVHRRAQADVSR